MSTNKKVFSKACALALTGAFLLTGCGDTTQPTASMPNQTPAAATNSGDTNQTATNSTDTLVQAAQQATNSAVDQAQQNLDNATSNYSGAQNTLTAIVDGVTSTHTPTTTSPTPTTKPATSYTLAQYEAAKKAVDEAQTALTKATNDYNTAVANRDKLNTAVAKAQAQLAAEDPSYIKSTPIDWSKVDQETTANVVESIVYAKVNEYRMNQGLPALAYTATGSTETLKWCETMAAAGHIYHADLREKNASAENVLQTFYGEGVLIQGPKRTNSDGSALIYDNEDPEELTNDIFRLWKNSEGHDRIFLLNYTESMAISVYFADDDRVYATLREYAPYNSRDDLTVLADPEKEYGITTVSQDTTTRGAYKGAITPSDADYTTGLAVTDLTPNLHATTTVESSRYNELESQVKALQAQQTAANAAVAKAAAAKETAQDSLDAAKATVTKIESGVIVGGIEAERPTEETTAASATGSAEEVLAVEETSAAEATSAAAVAEDTEATYSTEVSQAAATAPAAEDVVEPATAEDSVEQ